MCILPWERHITAELILSCATANPMSSNKLLRGGVSLHTFLSGTETYPQFILPLRYLFLYVSANSVTLYLHQHAGNTVFVSDDTTHEKEACVFL